MFILAAEETEFSVSLMFNFRLSPLSHQKAWSLKSPMIQKFRSVAEAVFDCYLHSWTWIVRMDSKSLLAQLWGLNVLPLQRFVSVLENVSLESLPTWITFSLRAWANSPHNPPLFLEDSKNGSGIASLSCRYTFFIVLYPMGVTGELLTIYAALPYVQKTGLYSVTLPNKYNFSFDYYTFLILIMISYIPRKSTIRIC